MKTYTQKWIMRHDLQNNPDVYFLFGTNTASKGLGGQAKEIRAEPNVIGIATKLTPTSGSHAFFSGDDFQTNCRIITTEFLWAFQKRDEGHLIIIPADGTETGVSELPTRDPKTNEFIEWMLELLKICRQQSCKHLINGG